MNEPTVVHAQISILVSNALEFLSQASDEHELAAVREYIARAEKQLKQLLEINQQAVSGD